MNCPKCGASLQSQARFCPVCGHNLGGKKAAAESEVTRKGFGWFKLLILGLLLLAGYSLWKNYSVENPIDVIENQLNAIKNNKITEAYYAYTSKDFQSVTPLDKFKEFVKAYPILSQTQTADLELKDGPKDDVKVVEGDLIGSNKRFMPVEYQLILEDSKWKILFMRFLTENPIKTDAERNEVLTNSPAIKDSMMATVKSFLDELKAGQYGSAYSKYTTKAFQSVTSLEAFRQFIEAYPIVYQYNSYQFGDYSLEGANGNINVTLNDNEQKASLVFNLNKNDKGWQIQGVHHVEQSHNTQELPEFNSKVLVTVIQDQLSAIKQGELGRAYYDFTTENFRKKTSFTQFSNFVNANPAMVFNAQSIFDDLRYERNSATFTTVLTSIRGISRRVSYELVLDNGQWKINNITVIDNTGANIPNPNSAKPLDFEKAVFGTQVDDTGKILDPSIIIKATKSEVYINLYVKKATVGDIIQIQLEYVENATKVPVIAYTLPSDGDQMITFSFAPPPSGWPKGNYQISLNSLSGAQRVFPFTIE